MAGLIIPAIALITDVLPDPDAPNSAVSSETVARPEGSAAHPGIRVVTTVYPADTVDAKVAALVKRGKGVRIRGGTARAVPGRAQVVELRAGSRSI